jgi:hypothetical protein
VDDPMQLSLRVTQILQDEKLANAMALHNLEKSQLYTIETMTKCHIEIFRNLKKHEE